MILILKPFQYNKSNIIICIVDVHFLIRKKIIRCWMNRMVTKMDFGAIYLKYAKNFQSWLSVQLQWFRWYWIRTLMNWYYYFKMNWIPFINANIVEHLFKSIYTCMYMQYAYENFVSETRNIFCDKNTVQPIKMPAKYFWIELENNAITCSEVRTGGCSKQLTICNILMIQSISLSTHFMDVLLALNMSDGCLSIFKL